MLQGGYKLITPAGLSTRSKEHYLLTFAKINSLTWGITKGKDHLDLPCDRVDMKTSPLLVYPPEARSITCSQSPKETQLGYHQQQRALLALLILAQKKLAKLKQGALPAHSTGLPQEARSIPALLTLDDRNSLNLFTTMSIAQYPALLTPAEGNALITTTCKQKLTQKLLLAKRDSLNWFTTKSNEHYLLLHAKRNLLNWLTTKNKEHYLLLLAKRNLLNWFTTKSKEHYLLLLAERNLLNWFTTKSKQHLITR